MQFIRFQSLQPCEGTRNKLGIFQTAFAVRDHFETSRHDAREIERQLNWLKQHLHSPQILVRPENFRAICWFKSTAREPMKRIWAIRPFLEAYGHWIEIITCWDPGLIIYEDGWQVAAKPRKGQSF